MKGNATENLETNAAFVLEPRKTIEKVDLFGPSQGLPDIYYEYTDLTAVRRSPSRNLAAVPTCADGLFLKTDRCILHRLHVFSFGFFSRTSSIYSL
jgi:hypothetical protein